MYRQLETLIPIINLQVYVVHLALRGRIWTVELNINDLDIITVEFSLEECYRFFFFQIISLSSSTIVTYICSFVFLLDKSISYITDSFHSHI